MLKIGSCTVLFNPDTQVIENIKTYADKVDLCVVVDNSDIKNMISDKIKNNSKIIYINMNGNKGIAAALNRGIDELNKNGIEFALTMDQDSKFPEQYYNNIIKLLEKYKNKYSVIGLNYNRDVEPHSEDIIEAPYWLTSGNFVNIHDFYIAGRFNEELFIDYVDIEYGHKLYKNNLKLCYLKDYSLIHKIGNPIEIRVFNKRYYAMNHSPIRYYYRYRNSFFLYLQDRKFYGREFLREIFINIPKMIFYEGNIVKKISMLVKGLSDARRGRLGKYDR